MNIPLIPALLVLLAGCGAHDQADEAHDHHVETEHRGPHGGRMLEQGPFALEVTIFERGVPPQFRLYATRDGKPIAPQEVQVTMALSRVNGLPGGAVDRHAFTPQEDFLTSPQEVHEPHSFSVEVEASHAGQHYTWKYDSPEGRVTIPADIAASQKIETAVAGGGAIGESLMLYGRIQPHAERLRAVAARYPGIVQSVAVQVGDAVRAGQQLAIVESNESLRSYAITAPIAGTVMKRNANPGENTGSEPLFEIANFSTVWAELAVFPRDRGRLKSGQAVHVTAADGALEGDGRIGPVSPQGTMGAALVARVELDNAAGNWTPGQFVNAQVTLSQSQAALVVPLTALQTFRDWDVVAVNEGEQYQLQPVELGRRDARNAEVLGGLAAGARIVVSNSYLIKADVEKFGASHDH